MTRSHPTPQLPGKSIEEVARLVEESSLGTAGARQLRDRVPAGIATAIRARVYFADTDTGRAWWEANQRNPDALCAMARVLAADGDLDISDVLITLANRQGTVTSAGRNAGQVPHDALRLESACDQETAPEHPARTVGWRTFEPFYRDEFEPLNKILCAQADLPPALGTKLITQAMVQAFDDWELVTASGNPGEWVLGRALQLFRNRQLPDEDDSWSPTGCAAPLADPVSSPRSAAGLDAGVRVTGALTVTASQVPLTSAAVGWTADQAVTTLYTKCYRSLVRLAALLVDDVPTAEEVVQDAFVAMHGGWPRLRDTDKAVAYLRQAVVNRARSVLRHRTVIGRRSPMPPTAPNARHSANSMLERSAVVTALRSLPIRQREAIVLRYYADLSDTEIAHAMGISRGAVKSHIARGMTSLRAALD